MSGSLVSPGVQVQIKNESFYGSAGPGTVPFILMATAENKPQPGNTTSTAPGSVKANANSLQLVTSQRELIQYYGNPTFYTQAGTPQHGSELNEYGLYSAYQYLGIANRALVMRANIDLGSLVPTSTPPSGEPLNGDLWLDLSNTSWGAFRSNGNINSSLAWGALKPTVLSSSAQFERFVQGQRPGTGLLPDITTVTLETAVITSITATFGIAGVDIVVSANSKMADIVRAINTNTQLIKMGVRAEIFARNQLVAGAIDTVYNLRIISSDTTLNIKLSRIDIERPAPEELATTALINALGFVDETPTNHLVPMSSIGSEGDIAVNAVGYLDQNGNLIQSVQMCEKIALVTDVGTDERWFVVGSTETTHPGWSWKAARPTKVQSSVGLSSNVAFTAGNKCEIILGNVTPTIADGIEVSPASVQKVTVEVGALAANQTLQGFVNTINEEFAAEGVNALASITTAGIRQNTAAIRQYLTITNFDGTDIEIHDHTGSPMATANISSSQTYYENVTGFLSPNTIPAGKIEIKVGNITSNAINIDEIVVVLDSDGDPVLPVPTSLSTLTAIATAINADTKVGTTGLIVASVLSRGGNNYLRITCKTGASFSIRNIPVTPVASPGVTPVFVSVLDAVGIPAGTTYGTRLTYGSYTLANPQPSGLDATASDSIWINTVTGNRGANFAFKRYSISSDSWESKMAPLYLRDDLANAAYGNRRTAGSAFVQYSAATATLEVKVWNGSTWVPPSDYNMINSYSQNFSEPKGTPADGTLWYNALPQVDIMVNTGSEWKGYKNVFTNTDAKGPILSGSEPSYQSDGSTPLQNNDIWVDTSDLENYPRISRWDAFTETWVLIDNTDQVTSSGIVFGDARADDGGVAHAGAPSTLISEMILSDLVDQDAPNALNYPMGMLLFNTRYSTLNVKTWNSKLYKEEGQWVGRWVTASGNKADGSPYMGRHAQRAMVVKAMASAVVSSEELRSEVNFFNLLAAPGYPELAEELINLNKDKKNIAFVIIDAPARLSPDGTSVQNWAKNAANATETGEQALTSGTASPYAAVYYPWGLATNLDGNPIVVPPSMTVLRTFAFNDQVAYPWFAPAGFNRGLVSALGSVGYLNSSNEYVAIVLNQGQRDVLYFNKINPIAAIPGRGLVIYGQKTLDPLETSMNRVNVARLVNYLNYNLDILGQPFLFEPNDRNTWGAVTRTFESFFNDLVSLRGVYDFAVLCNETTNTASRIDRNELWIDIAIKPEKAIEFIYIPLRLLNTGDPMPSSR